MALGDLPFLANSRVAGTGKRECPILHTFEFDTAACCIAQKPEPRPCRVGRSIKGEIMSDQKSNNQDFKAVVLDPNRQPTKPAEAEGNKVTAPAEALPE